VTVAVALGDKFDTLCGFWAIDEKPTGSKDPFALRRAALGVIRIVLENELRLNIGTLAQTHIAAIANDADEAVALDLVQFFHDRLKVYLRDEGIRHDVIDACLAMEGNDDIALVVKRARALAAFLETQDGENLLQGFKRANNILTQAEDKDGVEYSFGADAKFAEDASETTLLDALSEKGRAISSAIEAEDFASAMQSMASLRAPIDAFFEAVQVNADNDVVRRNRLNMLGQIRKTCLTVADLVQVEG
jgi:glycyl-tRNA synthetase beta chain